MSHICSTNSFHYVWSELDSLPDTRSASLSSSPLQAVLHLVVALSPTLWSLTSQICSLMLGQRLRGSQRDFWALSLCRSLLLQPTPQIPPHVPKLHSFLSSSWAFQKVSLVGHTSLSSLLSGVTATSEIVASYTLFSDCS